jgi:hypothetical protein
MKYLEAEDGASKIKKGFYLLTTIYGATLAGAMGGKHYVGNSRGAKTPSGGLSAVGRAGEFI